MNAAADVIVVGSGPSAVNAAYPLVRAGRAVTMLDVGHEDTVYRALIPKAPFAEVRRGDPRQHRYFLGDRFEGVPLGMLGAAPQLIPPRQYVVRGAEAEVMGPGAVHFCRVAPLDADTEDSVWTHVPAGKRYDLVMRKLLEN